ncbi:DUF4150 domain-containing protein [Mesorhizobium sp. M0622]|uniref:DUF4150 domain-containing protein n=1 Tax=unclassified Mesorhizobium TaxID=325217 RepID=UPI0033385FCA
MTKDVFAEKWEIAGKNGMNQSIARFPDVCMSPPSPPAGPIPVPYPNTSFSSDLKEGSETVYIGGKPVALAQKSYYKTSPLGNEAATRTFGASVITHQITGKTYFQSWCMSVKFEDKNVCRHIDLTTSNHASHVGATPPQPSRETQNFKQAKKAVEAGKCPCCGLNLHSWQKDPATNKAYPVMKENDFWKKKVASIKPTKATEQAHLSGVLKKMNRLKAKNRRLAKEGKPSCPNVHKADNQGCALYFDIPKGARIPSLATPAKPAGPTPAQAAYDAFTPLKKTQVTRAWERVTKQTVPAAPPAGSPPGTPNPGKLNHKTPRMAGGCNNKGNVVPQHFMDYPECNEIENLQSELEKVNDLLP